MNKTQIDKHLQSPVKKKKVTHKKGRQYKHILDSDIQISLSEKITKRLNSVQIIV